MFNHISTLVTVTGLILASGAQASTIQVNDYVYSKENVHITGHSGWVGAGGFNAVLDGSQSFISYCIDTSQNFKFKSSFSVTTTTVSAQFGANKALAMGQLYTQNYASISTADQSAAFQLALWEIINEQTGNSYSLANGTFNASSLHASAASLANTWLSGLSGAGNAYTFTAYISATKQDQLRASLASPVPTSSVPVPGALALLMSGLGLLGAVARSRKQTV